MTTHDLTISVYVLLGFGSVSFIAFMVTLWMLIDANWRAENNRLGEMHWSEKISEANNRIENAIFERDSWERACRNAEDKIEQMEAQHQVEMNRRIIKIIHLNAPPKPEKFIPVKEN